MITYYINIGTNLGNRKLNLSRALVELEKIGGYFETSRAMESDAWGYESDNKFLNMGVAMRSDLQPAAMLALLKEAEKRLCADSHRTAEGGYADRVIDIDIMAADEMIVDTPDLKIPHPHLAERKFFIVPMMELAPAWRDPRDGRQLIEIYRKLES